MRGVVVFMLSLAMVSGADASSILVLSAKPGADPSILTLDDAGTTNSIVAAGATEPGTTASPSLVVLGDPVVNTEKVAAIPAGKQPRAGAVHVIRAGVVGGASTVRVAAAATAPTATSASAAGNAGADGKAPTLRDAMTQAGRAPALPQ